MGPVPDKERRGKRQRVEMVVSSAAGRAEDGGVGENASLGSRQQPARILTGSRLRGREVTCWCDYIVPGTFSHLLADGGC